MNKNIYKAFLEGKTHKQVIDEGFELEGICEICGDECEDLFEHLCIWHTETDILRLKLHLEEDDLGTTQKSTIDPEKK